MWQRCIKYSMLNRVAKKVYSQSYNVQSCFTEKNLPVSESPISILKTCLNSLFYFLVFVVKYLLMEALILHTLFRAKYSGFRL